VDSAVLYLALALQGRSKDWNHGDARAFKKLNEEHGEALVLTAVGFSMLLALMVQASAQVLRGVTAEVRSFRAV
jgi:hypothetical protein